MSMLPRIFGASSGVTPQNDPFGAFQREVNRVFDEVFRGFPAMGGRGAALMGGFAPSLDVHETEQGLEITAELPGMGEDDVELRLEGDLLSLSGEKRSERAETQGGMHMSERSYGRFQRAFRLPFRPMPDQVRAEFDKGILKITLPKPQEQSGGGRIPIARGQQGGASGGGGGINMGAPAASPDGGPPPMAGGNANGNMNPGSQEFKEATKGQ